MNSEGPILPTKRAADLNARPPEQRWLIERLWAERGVGIVGGEPKCGKSFLALDLAVAVSTGCPALSEFEVLRAGPVLLYAAEDQLSTVRERLDSIARARGTTLERLALHVITAPTLRLDHDSDCERLMRTVAALKPRFLVLDPLARLHRIDENVAGEIAPLLAYLRQIERKLACSVLLVHHARKGAHHLRAGQALRGSSELHAWGDSNLYLRRKDRLLRLSIEHRAAESPEDLTLELDSSPGLTALRICRNPSSETADPPALIDPCNRIEQALNNSSQPLSIRQLRHACRMRTETLCRLLETMIRDGRVLRTHTGFCLARRPSN